MADTLNQTMSKDQLQASPDDMISRAYSRLNDMLAQIPGIDYQAKFAPMIAEAQAQPIPKGPSAVSTFAQAMGNPSVAHEGLQNKISEIEKAKAARDEQVNSLKMQALQGDIDQAMTKGKFKQALAQSEVLQQLQSKLDDVKRAKATQDYIDRTKYLFGEKNALAEKQKSRAEELIKTKAKEVAKSMGFDDKLTLKLLDLTVAPALAQMRAMFSRNPLTGEMEVDADQQDAIVQAMNSYVAQVAARLKEEHDAGTTPTATSAPKPAAAPSTTAPSATTPGPALSKAGGVGPLGLRPKKKG